MKKISKRAARKLAAVFMGLIMCVMISPIEAEARYKNTSSIYTSIVFDSDLAACEANVVGFVYNPVEQRQGNL